MISIVCMVLSFLGCNNDVNKDAENDFKNPHEYVGIEHNENLRIVLSNLTIIPQDAKEIKSEVFSILKNNGIGNHLMFNHFSFLEAKFIHNTGNTIRSKQTHQIIFK